MPRSIFQPLMHSLRTLSSVTCDLIRLVVLLSRSRRALAAETLFLRKQLALIQERKVKPHRAHDSTRLVMVIWAACSRGRPHSALGPGLPEPMSDQIPFN